MGAVVAIGARTSVSGLALAGVAVLVAEDPDAVRRAWQGLSDGVGLVFLTASAAAVLGTVVPEPDPSRPLTVVMP